MECSQIVRRQSNNCPICRTKVSTFIQIKDDHNNPKTTGKGKETGLKKLKDDLKNTKAAKPNDDEEDAEEEEEEEENDLEEAKNVSKT